MSLENDMRNAEDAMLHRAENYFEDFEQIIETEDTAYMVCPYCGYNDRDSDEVEPDNGVHECPKCGEEYDYERSRDIKYTTWRI